MTSDMKDKVEAILRKCHTLTDAEDMLKPVIKSRAMRWGLFDGWDGRLRCTSGLAIDPVPKQIEQDYNEGCEIGRKLAMIEVPA